MWDKLKKEFHVVINVMPQILSVELNLYWTWKILLAGNAHQLH